MAPIDGLCAPQVCSEPPTPARLSPGALDVFGTEESHLTLAPSTMQLRRPWTQFKTARTAMRNRAGRGMARAAALTRGPLPPVGPQVPDVTDARGADVASRLSPKEPCSLPSKEGSQRPGEEAGRGQGWGWGWGSPALGGSAFIFIFLITFSFAFRGGTGQLSWGRGWHGGPHADHSQRRRLARPGGRRPSAGARLLLPQPRAQAASPLARLQLANISESLLCVLHRVNNRRKKTQKDTVPPPKSALIEDGTLGVA